MSVRHDVESQKQGRLRIRIALSFIILPLLVPALTFSADSVDIGSRRELFVDEYLIERMDGVRLELHHPVARELVWEQSNQVNGKEYGGANRSVTVLQDGDIYRMYYREYARVKNFYRVPGSSGDDDIVVCYAESRDGIHWERPTLDLYQTDDLKVNNIVWAGTGGACFAVFKDANPRCSSDARYKAIGRVMFESGNDPAPPQPDETGYDWLPGCGLMGFQSPDGIHWSLLSDKRIIKKGEFDSYNVAMWDGVRDRYIAFIRVWLPNGHRVRSVAMLTSDNFLEWSDPPAWLEYNDVPDEHLYDNDIAIYPRAPHLFIGVPMRLVGGRVKVHGNPLAEETAINDTGLMTSRDGLHFHRWREAFIRPGPSRGGWWNENNCPAWGFVETPSHIEDAPPELSFYVNRWYGAATGNLRRYTLRLDGFVSLDADAKGGEVVTRPVIFSGNELTLNYATSAVGSVQVELQDERGNAIAGYSLEDCPLIFGDEVDHVVHWKSGTDVSGLAGQPVRLRLVLKDADVYSLQFCH